jgi:Uma2 family endonuclease
MGKLPKPTGVIVYPDSDGKPMAENTLQYEWIVTIKGNLDRICVGDRAAFVAGDNLIYPVEGDPTICKAPDVYVAFGRPRGHRGSYKVWEEGGVFPQVIFEILSPGNSQAELIAKRRFYRRYGAIEYIVYDPDDHVLDVHVREGNRLVPVDEVNGWVSPLLGIRFDMSGDELAIYRPDGTRFLSFDEICDEAQAAKQLAVEADKRARNAETDAKIAEAQRQKSEAERMKAEADSERLRAKLRAAGIDPDTP